MLVEDPSERRGETPGSVPAAPPESGASADPDATQTIPPSRDPGSRPASTQGAATFPVRDWDRYEHERLLGQGGMGAVFLAKDRRLGRRVALKFVRGDSPQHTARLLVEARAQARVEHERICKVYEVGEVQGQIYIAMQYIDGQPLGAAFGDLSFEQRAMVLRDAALGLHEAHRAGIVHRDVKPGNIMIERGAEGQIKTYVMDFGLARDWKEGQTETGTIMGTPHYMAPEQARGEVGQLDRRADVYGLGATLYHVLSNEPPIPGTNALEVLSNIGTFEPRALRALDGDIPPDLEAIALKCLEKERARRYESARALADDLDRFLNGEPVRAGHVGAWYRLKKRIRKHKALVAGGALVLLVVILSLGWVAKTRSEAALRERLAQRFGQRVEQVEAMARYSALSRLHDIRGDRVQILSRIREIESEMGAAGPVAAGPGAYAIGRGYLALGELDLARDALESAWSHGFREPRAAYALALVLGQQYQRELAETERIKSDPARAEKKREIDARYRDPALSYLRMSEGADVPSREYVAALMAYHEGRWDDALARLDAIGEALPWFYEAPKLRGDVLLARAIAALRGGDGARARADFEAGRKAYEAACGAAESVPDMWQAAADLEYQALIQQLYGEGDVETAYQRATAAVSRALAVHPDHHVSLLLDSRLHRSLAEHRINRGEKADDILARAVAAAERAIHASPSSAAARLELSRAHRQWGEARAGIGADPSAELTKALAAAEAVPPEDRNFEHHVNLGLIFKVRADYQDDTGKSSLDDRGKAIAAYTTAFELNPRAHEALINLAANYQERAGRADCPDPDGDLQEAASALDKALALQPEHVVAHFYQGNVRTRIGALRRAKGADPRPDFLAAAAAYEAGLRVNPRLHYLHNGLGLVLLDLADDARDRGESMEPFLARAKAAFGQAISHAPDQAWGYNGAALVHDQRAEHERWTDGDPARDLAAATSLFAEAVKRLPDHPNVLVNSARHHVLVAEVALERGGDVEASLREATRAIERALELNPESATAHVALGEARRVRAARTGKGAGADEDFESAAKAYRKALELDPSEQIHFVLFAALCRSWALSRSEAGRDEGAVAVAAEGLRALEKVLAVRATWPEARALRGSLLLFSARLEKDAQAARDRAARALDDLGAAVRANPTFEKRWRQEMASARQLAAPQ